MKDTDFTAVVAVTLDQRRSRTHDDHVPALVEALAGLPGLLLSPERTAGDEVQLLLGDAAAVVRLVEVVTRLGDWWVGLGAGAVEAPLPASTREARGPAYLAAREAVGRAHSSPTGLALAAYRTVGAGGYGRRMSTTDAVTRAATRAEGALWLQQSLLASRSPQGWEVCDLLDDGLGVAEAAARLGISPSAVSQRHARAGWEQGRRGRELCTALVDDLLGEVAA